MEADPKGHNTKQRGHPAKISMPLSHKNRKTVNHMEGIRDLQLEDLVSNIL